MCWKSWCSPTWVNMDLTQITKPLTHTTHGQNFPVAAHCWVKAVRTLFKFAIDQEGLSTQYFTQQGTRNLMGVCAIVEMR